MISLFQPVRHCERYSGKGADIIAAMMKRHAESRKKHSTLIASYRWARYSLIPKQIVVTAILTKSTETGFIPDLSMKYAEMTFSDNARLIVML